MCGSGVVVMMFLTAGTDPAGVSIGGSGYDGEIR